jgi:hypothetical protein
VFFPSAVLRASVLLPSAALRASVLFLPGILGLAALDASVLLLAGVLGPPVLDSSVLLLPGVLGPPVLDSSVLLLAVLALLLPEVLGLAVLGSFVQWVSLRNISSGHTRVLSQCVANVTPFSNACSESARIFCSRTAPDNEGRSSESSAEAQAYVFQMRNHCLNTRPCNVTPGVLNIWIFGCLT